METQKKIIGNLTGNEGENAAADYLASRGYKLLAQNWHCHFGEIDIVAQHKKKLVFVEVKTQRSRRFGLPEQQFTKIKKYKLRRAIQNYFWQNKLDSVDWRVDLICLDYSQDEPALRHYQAVEFPYY